MAYKIPWSNFHELNLDWLLQQVKELRTDVDGLTGSATPSDNTPEMDGVGTPGTTASYSRGNHRHPTDTSRAAASDLTQEITDRGNADITLQTNIDAVDAKIKFSAAAPLMDSSSASAGFSDFLARADHVHPTDTSRASATDLAVLEARVDGFTGSALPSDLTPNMDGIGSAGTGGNYSRGDHVHPSDTSKLDVAGGTITGNLEVNGFLNEKALRLYGASNATGWLRVAYVPQTQGTQVTLKIERKGSSVQPELHNITLIITTNIEFIDEISISDSIYIDKIRYTSAGYIDIHMDATYSADVNVSIDVSSSDKTTWENSHVMSSMDFISDTPAGETILETYNFSQNHTPQQNIKATSSTSFAAAVSALSAILDINLTYWSDALTYIQNNIGSLSTGVTGINAGGPYYFTVLGKYSTSYYCGRIFNYGGFDEIFYINSNGTYSVMYKKY
ncbi:MAG: hypothetical protein IIZ93_10125 [Acidaminococcaceae bacterium]|nr:hypothetical protein [Acidaminococcaceae bacterium]